MFSSIVKSSTNKSLLPAIQASRFSTSSLVMADPTRQSATDKAASAVTPDSEKTMTQKAKDGLDSAASTLQPNENKSTTQKATDALSGNSNENSSSLMDKAKSVLGMDTDKK